MGRLEMVERQMPAIDPRHNLDAIASGARAHDAGLESPWASGLESTLAHRVCATCVGIFATLIVLFVGLSSRIALAERGRAMPGVTVNNGEAEYLLGPLDKVRLRVLEYRASRDEIYEWTPLGNEYTIGPSGRIAIPLIGEINAAGHTTASLSGEIAERLKQRIGLAVRPDATIEIVQYRPIYVLGFVEKPGEYTFRPGLTVLQAVTISGGLHRKSDEGMTRIERDIINVRGDIDQATTEFLSLVARRARLEAELNAQLAITFPVPLNRYSGVTAVRQIMEKEQMLFEARREARANQLTALTQLRTFLTQEAASLEKQIGTHDQQIALFKDEMSSILALSKQKLITEPRRLALERSIAQAEGDRLRLETALMRSRQEHSRTNIMIVELDTKRITDLTTELQQTQIRLEHVRLKVDTANQLLRSSEARVPSMVLTSQAGLGGSSSSLRYSVVRRVGGRSTEISADEATVLQPGDTVRVDFIGPEGSDQSGPPTNAARAQIPQVWEFDQPHPVPAAVR